jgi:hypothetical protein
MNWERAKANDLRYRVNWCYGTPAYPIQNESDQPILLNMGYQGYSDQYKACWFVKT